MAKKKNSIDSEDSASLQLPEPKKPRKEKQIKPKKIRKYKKKQRATSVYFLVWSIFSALSLLIVLLFGITQQVLTVQTFKDQASKDVSETGKSIRQMIVKTPPQSFGGNYSSFLRFLANEYGVDAYLLNEKGEVLFPRDEQFDPNASPETKAEFSDKIEELKETLEEEKTESVVYEGEGEYVYGTKIQMYGEVEVYLYIGKSLALVEEVSSMMTVRIVLISLFVFVLSFAVSSAVSGWLTKPMSEMTHKARLLARGNFEVDFHGTDYGQEMVELADTLNFARDELSKTDRMQKELIANVSHDFKTPLTMIKAYASMIMEISGDIPEKRNKHAQVIVDEADRLVSLVNDLLDLSKISSGIVTLQKDVLDMSAYTLEILERFAYLKETSGYVFETEIDEDLYTTADKVKIGQVLYNLIGNAVNYTGEDKTVYVRLKKEGEFFRFSVTDTGSGIKPEEMESVWERYYRSSEMHKRPVKGTGLGLSIVKMVLEKHNFRFGIESEVGKGSTFYVVFPLVVLEEVEE